MADELRTEWRPGAAQRLGSGWVRNIIPERIKAVIDAYGGSMKLGSAVAAYLTSEYGSVDGWPRVESDQAADMLEELATGQPKTRQFFLAALAEKADIPPDWLTDRSFRLPLPPELPVHSTIDAAGELSLFYAYVQASLFRGAWLLSRSLNRAKKKGTPRKRAPSKRRPNRAA